MSKARPNDLTLEDLLHPERCSDPELARMYARKLLIRGWAGALTPAEREYRQYMRTHPRKEMDT